jgi:hypothetical protein
MSMIASLIVLVAISIGARDEHAPGIGERQVGAINQLGANRVGDVDDVEPGIVGEKLKLDHRGSGAGSGRSHEFGMERVVHVELDDAGVGADVKRVPRSLDNAHPCSVPSFQVSARLRKLLRGS